MIRRRVLLASSAAAVLATLTGCGGDGDKGAGSAKASPRPVTSDEAALLATTRFQNFNAGTRSFLARYASRDTVVETAGWVNFENHIGYAAIRPDSLQPGLIGFNATEAYVSEAKDSPAIARGLRLPTGPTDVQIEDESMPPLPPPKNLFDGSIPVTALDPKTSTDQAVVAILARLSDDRPENPLLLQQNGAQWIEDVTIAGTETSAYTVTKQGNATYWINADGLLLRMKITVGDQEVYYAFGPGEGTSLPRFRASLGKG